MLQLSLFWIPEQREKISIPKHVKNAYIAERTNFQDAINLDTNAFLAPVCIHLWQRKALQV